MSLSYHEIEQLNREIAPKLIGKQLLGITEHSDRKFILDFGSESLLFCFKDPFLRFHLTTLRKGVITHIISQKINTMLAHTVLKEMKVLNQDRILLLEFKNYKLIAEFFSKRPNFYLLENDGTVIASLNPVSPGLYQTPSVIQQVQKTESSVTGQSIEAFYRTLENQTLFEQRKHSLESKIKLELNRLKKRQKKEENELEQALKWPQIQHEALLFQSNLYRIKKGMESLIVSDWEQDGKETIIQMDMTLEPQDEVSKKFKCSRKLKASIPYIQKQLEKYRTDLIKCEQTLKTILEAQSVDELKQFEENVQQKEVVKDVLPYREYTSSSGLKIWVGKSASKNDILTFNYARGSDWWLHVSGFSGSHVIIRVNKNVDPDHEALQDALQLALHYSKAKQEGGADVCVTQKKYVSRFGKKQPGKVQISKHKIVYVKIDPNRFARLKIKE